MFKQSVFKCSTGFNNKVQTKFLKVPKVWGRPRERAQSNCSGDLAGQMNISFIVFVFFIFIV